MNVKSKAEFEEVWKKNRKIMLTSNRTPSIYITPNSNIITNYKEILPSYMKIESEEIWMLFNDFRNLKSCENLTGLKITINSNSNLNDFTNVFMDSYEEVSEEDPYGKMPNYYRTAILNYKDKNDIYQKSFYTILIKNLAVGCALTVIKDNIALIGFVGTLKEYRNKGICKSLMINILNNLKDKNIEFAYLQTEQGFLPEKLYTKLGFETVCKAIIAVEENYND